MVHIVTTSQRGRADPLGAPSRLVVQIDVIKTPSGADSWTQPLWRGAHHASIPGVLAHVDFSKDKHMVASLEALR